MSWTPATQTDREEMLKTIGVTSIEELFSVIPPEFRVKDWAIPAGMSEMATRELLSGMASKNTVEAVSFLGGGYYDHYIPAAIDALTSRSEFYTAYTPYQPECAQGTLQSIYEYQSAITRLTNMEFSNASLYEGGTAVFEAAAMAMRITRRNIIICHPSLNPKYLEMLHTHTLNLDIEIVERNEPAEGACFIFQNPGFTGTVNDFTDLVEACRAQGTLAVSVFYPLSLGLLKTPGEMGVDIAIAEGQSLGIPLSFGGPYLGILTTLKKHVRKMPGRIAGATQDAQGRRGYVLTLQAREQHIRRVKAMSNICSNQALCALRALMYLCLMGKEGLRELAVHCHSKAEYLKTRLDFAEILNEGPTFNEFAVRLPRPAREVTATMMERGFLAGLPLADVGAGDENDLLIAVTEQRTREQIDAYADALKEVSCN